MTDDALRIGWTRAQAVSARATYRGFLGLVLILELVLGLLALAAPVWLSHVLALPDPMPRAWMRMFGAMQIVAVLLYFPGWREPVFRRWQNSVGILARFLLGLLYLGLGGAFRWLGVLALVFAVILGVTYWRLLRAELMSRP
jgi:VanZ family protein